MDRVGPRRIVICAELLQALGAVTYLAARGTAMVAVAAVLLAGGQQLFYSSLFALIADVAGDGPRDRPFAVAAMVRSACFGLGGLAAAALLSWAGTGGYRVAVIVDAASFAVCALLLGSGPGSAAWSPAARATGAASGGPWSDRPFLALIVVTGLVALPLDFYLSGMSVYVLGELHAEPWLPGAALALYTGLNSAGATAALWATRRLRRTTAMAWGAALFVVWCGISVAAVAMPARWRAADLLAGTVVLAAAGLAFGVRVNALAEATAPAAGAGPLPGRFPVLVHGARGDGPGGGGAVLGGGMAALAPRRGRRRAGRPGLALARGPAARRCAEAGISPAGRRGPAVGGRGVNQRGARPASSSSTTRWA